MQLNIEEAIRIAFYHSLRYHPSYGNGHHVTAKVKSSILLQDTDCIAGDVFASVTNSFRKYKIKYEDVVKLFFKKHPYSNLP